MRSVRVTPHDWATVAIFPTMDGAARVATRSALNVAREALVCAGHGGRSVPTERYGMHCPRALTVKGCAPSAADAGDAAGGAPLDINYLVLFAGPVGCVHLNTRIFFAGASLEQMLICWTYYTCTLLNTGRILLLGS